MKKKAANILRSKRGESYIDMVIMVFVAMMVIVLALNVFSYLTLKQDLDYVTSKLSEAAALEGLTSSSKISGLYAQLCEDEKLDTDAMELTVTADEFYNYQKHEVQLGDTITVTVTCKTEFKGLGALGKVIDISCVSEKSSLSRVYWKD